MSNGGNSLGDRNYRWYDPRGLLNGPWRFRAARLTVLFICALVAGFPLYDSDVISYPEHFQGYLERYTEFIIDPFDDHQFNTHVEIVGGSWKRGYGVEKFDGQYWLFDKEITKTGSGTLITDPEPLPPLVELEGEALTGRRQTRYRIEEYQILLRDLRSGNIYTCDDYIIFFRISDRHHCLKKLNASNYRAMLNFKGSWKASLLATREFGNRLLACRIFVSDQLFEEIKSWPDS